MVKVFRQLKRKGRKTAPEPSKEEHIFIGDSAIPSESASTVSWRSEGSLTCSTQLTPTNDKTPCETRGLQSNGVARSNSQENDLSSLSNKNEEIDSSLAIVLFNKPRPVPPPLPDSFKIWCKFKVNPPNVMVNDEITSSRRIFRPQCTQHLHC